MITATRNYKQLLDEVFVISRIIEVEVGVISRSRRLRLITLTETSIILNITKTESNNCFIIHWTEKIEVFFFASSLMPSSTKRANLTWLLLEIMHRGHTWYDYSWPWHDYCIICKFWRHGRWFQKFTVGSRPIKKELESWMYNNIQCLSASCVICRRCVIFRELSDRTTGEISKFTYYSIIWCMFSTKCHTIGEGRLTVCPRW